jgi:hypothetical protein
VSYKYFESPLAIKTQPIDHETVSKQQPNIPKQTIGIIALNSGVNIIFTISGIKVKTK